MQNASNNIKEFATIRVRKFCEDAVARGHAQDVMNVMISRDALIG
jgi:hypothetical protein